MLLVLCVQCDCVVAGWQVEFSTLFLLLFGETLDLFLSVIVTGFFAFHLYLMANGMTTIEFCEKRYRWRPTEHEGEDQPSRYSVSNTSPSFALCRPSALVLSLLLSALLSVLAFLSSFRSFFLLVSLGQRGEDLNCSYVWLLLMPVSAGRAMR